MTIFFFRNKTGSGRNSGKSRNDRRTARYTDLHIHSTASDGSVSPKQLVKMAVQCGLCAVALTDHDTLDGIAEALKAGDEMHLTVIPGVEVGVEYGREMHILGYFTPGQYLKISKLLTDTLGSRNERNPKILGKLKEAGFELSMEEVVREAGGKVISRPHFAAAMVKRGYAGSVKEAFDKYLGEGMPAYVIKDKLSPEECIGEINKAGGVAVLAHPMHMKLGDEGLDRTVAGLKEAGLKGIEAYYVDNTAADTKRTLAMAKRYSLLATGGSDFHGEVKPGLSLGKGYGSLIVPGEAADRLMELLEW